MPSGGYVYILASHRRRLYIGVTSDIHSRVHQHKQKIHPDASTARYNIDRLVHLEIFDSMNEAIARESSLKGILRIRKVELIVATNPTWRDLSKDWPATELDPTHPNPERRRMRRIPVSALR